MPPSSTVEEVTPRLQWLVVVGYPPRLQQCWLIKTYQQFIDVTECTGIREEWRDVPVAN